MINTINLSISQSKLENYIKNNKEILEELKLVEDEDINNFAYQLEKAVQMKSMDKDMLIELKNLLDRLDKISKKEYISDNILRYNNLILHSFELLKNYSGDNQKKNEIGIENFTKENSDLVQALIENIEFGYKELYKKQNWIEYLDTMSQFGNYSNNNMMLLAKQGASMLVKGYGAWRTEYNRQVKKGAKAYKILAPIPFKSKEKDENGNYIKDENGNIKEKIVKLSFKYINVFDYKDTEVIEGKIDKLKLFKVEELSGKAENYDLLKTTIEKLTDFSIDYNLEGKVKGICHLSQQFISINKDLSERHTLKTLLHEIAHSKLHSNNLEFARLHTKLKEIQAESVAYVVSKKIGLDTSDYSFDYIGLYAKDLKTSDVKEAINSIKSLSEELIEKFELELEKEKLFRLENEKIKSGNITLNDLNKIIEKNYNNEKEELMLNINSERSY